MTPLDGLVTEAPITLVPANARRVGIVMNGITGRMGANQHLARSIVAIRAQGGVACGDGRVIWPDPILVGRSEERVRQLADAHGMTRWSTDLAACLANPRDEVYFDAQTTAARPAAVRAAITAGKHVYSEKPLAVGLGESLELARLAREAGIKNGVVQDKLWLPGLLKLKSLLDSGFFGRVLSVRGEFGYWVFEGDWKPSQRPSWNYRREDGGGIVLDMFCHWRYVLDRLFGPVRSVIALPVTHIPERVDERGLRYPATADDAAYAMFELEGPEGRIVAQFNSSWCTRVRRDDLLTFHVDGTLGSAVAGLRDCVVQHRVNTPRAVWNPDVPQPIDLRAGWSDVPDTSPDNAFKAQWELFLRHVARDEPFPWDFLEGARGVQLAELGLRSGRERRWVEVPALETS